MQKSLFDRPAQREFEQVEANLFSYRNLLLYGMPLTVEQRQELLTDVERSLCFIRECTVSPPIQISPAEAANIFPVPEGQAERTLKELYRVYYTYLDEQQGYTVETFLARFQEIKDIIRDLQDIFELKMREKHIKAHNPVERVNQFIHELYSIFVDFLKALSGALENNDMHIRTEELTGSEAYGTEEHSSISTPLISLYRVYQLHQQLRTEEHFTERISEINTFLAFLEEQSTRLFNRQVNVSQQLLEARKLLLDCTLLLNAYEQAASTDISSR